MRSRRISLRVPWPLDDAMKTTCAALGFENDHACWIGAGIVFVQNYRRFKWVREIANAKPKDQSFMLEKMLRFPTDFAGMIRELKKLDKS